LLKSAQRTAYIGSYLHIRAEISPLVIGLSSTSNQHRVTFACLSLLILQTHAAVRQPLLKS
jgi:hypothetical protein